MNEILELRSQGILASQQCTQKDLTSSGRESEQCILNLPYFSSLGKVAIFGCDSHKRPGSVTGALKILVKLFPTLSCAPGVPNLVNRHCPTALFCLKQRFWGKNSVSMKSFF